MSRTTSKTIGETEIIVLTDGARDFPNAVFPDTDPDHIDTILSSAGKQSLETNFNAVLVKQPQGITLIDAGYGQLGGDVAGYLLDALAEARVTPEQVDRLFITHMHPDHCGGAIAPDKSAVFQNAEMILGDVEHAYWQNGDNFAGKGEKVEFGHHFACDVFAAYADRTTILTGEGEITPGLSMIPLPGHTIGHTGVYIETGTGEDCVVIADIVHVQDLQMADPSIGIMFDFDADQATRSRVGMLDRLASEQLLCCGGHLLKPGLGHVERHKEGYRFISQG